MYVPCWDPDFNLKKTFMEQQGRLKYGLAIRGY